MRQEVIGANFKEVELWGKSGSRRRHPLWLRTGVTGNFLANHDLHWERDRWDPSVFPDSTRWRTNCKIQTERRFLPPFFSPSPSWFPNEAPFFWAAMASSSSCPYPRVFAALIFFFLIGFSFVGADDVNHDDEDSPQSPSCNNPFQLVLLLFSLPSLTPFLGTHFIVLITIFWFIFISCVSNFLCGQIDWMRHI